MNNLNDLILDTNMSYREKIELIIGDKRGNFIITDELDEIIGGRKFAEERINFWLNWNKEYAKNHKSLDTQERYIKAQSSSKVYALAVYKSIISLICSKIHELSFRQVTTEESVRLLQELLWIYAGGSLLMMKTPLGTIQHISRLMKKRNHSISLYLDEKFKNSSESYAKDWIKQFA